MNPGPQQLNSQSQWTCLTCDIRETQLEIIVLERGQTHLAVTVFFILKPSNFAENEIFPDQPP